MKQHHKTPEVAEPINSEALWLSRALRWIPLEHDAMFAETYLLEDFQRGWFLNLYLGCLRSRIPGYLGPVTGPTALELWKFAGARSERSFRGHSTQVLAAYRFADIEGEKYLYHPRLLAVIVEQLTKLRKRRRVEDSAVSSLSTCGEQLPLLLFQALKKEKADEGRTTARRAGAKPLQPGTRTGVFADPSSGEDELLPDWLSDATTKLHTEGQTLLSQVQRERDPVKSA